jgi:SPP1 family phage portal protein
MEIEELINLISDPKKLIELITATKDKDFKDKLEKANSQWNVPEHDVMKPTIRKDKDGPDGVGTIKVARLGLPYQKQIVNRAAAFLVGNPVDLQVTVEDGSQEQAFVQVIKRIWDDNKLDYLSKKIAKTMMREMEVAELWYVEQLEGDDAATYWAGSPVEGAQTRMRCKILSNSNGDGLFPVFNKIGDMIAFARQYKITNGDQKEDHFDLYTADKHYFFTSVNGGAYSKEEEAELTGKISVIYYQQELVEWFDVQSLIQRIEFLISKLSDTNDYFGSPTVILETDDPANVEWVAKDQDGKAAILKGGAKASYLTWQTAPESIRLELVNLRSQIMDLTDTPDISFDQVKGLGTYSGIALKMIFMGAHMKAADKEETFGEGIQRRINFLKKAVAIIDTKFEKQVPLVIKPKFVFYTPKDYVEEVSMLLEATGGKPILSQETAVDMFSLIEDKQGEKDKLKAQDAAEKQQQQPAGGAGGLDNIMNT